MGREKWQQVLVPGMGPHRIGEAMAISRTFIQTELTTLLGNTFCYAGCT